MKSAIICGLLIFGTAGTALAADFAAGFRAARNGWRSVAAEHVRGPYTSQQRYQIVRQREQNANTRSAQANQNSKLGSKTDVNHRLAVALRGYGPDALSKAVRVLRTDRATNVVANRLASALQGYRVVAGRSRAKQNSKLTSADRRRIDAHNALVAGQRAYRPNTLRTRSYVSPSRRPNTITRAQLAGRGSRLSGVMR